MHDTNMYFLNENRAGKTTRAWVPFALLLLLTNSLKTAGIKIHNLRLRGKRKAARTELFFSRYTELSKANCPFSDPGTSLGQILHLT